MQSQVNNICGHDDGQVTLFIKTVRDGKHVISSGSYCKKCAITMQRNGALTWDQYEDAQRWLLCEE